MLMLIFLITNLFVLFFFPRIMQFFLIESTIIFFCVWPADKRPLENALHICVLYSVGLFHFICSVKKFDELISIIISFVFVYQTIFCCLVRIISRGNLR